MLQAAKLWIEGGHFVTIWKYNKWKKPTENDTNAGYTATGCAPLCRHITHYPPCMNLLPSPISPALPSAEADTITRTFLCDLSSRSPAMELWSYGDQCSVGWVTMEHCVAVLCSFLRGVAWSVYPAHWHPCPCTGERKMVHTHTLIFCI